MATDYIFITPEQLFFAATLIAVNIGSSFLLHLGLGRQWLIAALRMVGQLLLIGFLLDWIFTLNNPWWILGIALFMATTAAVTAVGRTKKRFPLIYWNSFISILAAVFFVMGLALTGILKVDPWYAPQYLFPLLGMVLGNTLNGISLGLDRFMENLSTRCKEVEMLLGLGATSWEATHELIRDALRTSMIPTLNSMMVMGVVSLPGMMTGQILAGASPSEAVRYQIVIVFMIAAAAACGATSVVILAFRRLFNSRHQLQIEQLRVIL
jgi:putative ABC transport system permease protein